MQTLDDHKRLPIRAAADWQEIVFICSECTRRSDEDETASLRKWLKRELKSRGFKKRIRIVECSCLGLCPKRGVVLARGSELATNERKKLRVHRAGDNPQALLDWLTNAPTD
jgi:predicted metal-binding protein